MTSHGAAGWTLPLDIASMEARSVDELPQQDGWQFEPKWDGFRCLTHCRTGEVELRGKSGKSLSRYFPEVVAVVAELSFSGAVLDGELVITIGDSLSFDALQARLHPAASRIRKLSVETPASLIVFDCLAIGGESLLDKPLVDRREALDNLIRHHPAAAMTSVRATPFTRSRSEAELWLAATGGALDGVVAKRLDGRYEPGERAMQKVKRLRTADCVVGGFRYGQGSREVGSLLLGLYNDEGKLDHVGFTSAIAVAERKALTKKLEAIRAEPGFTGNAPGGPSRWSTERSAQWQPLQPKLVVEVRYDQVTSRRFRHGTMLMRWRPDKAPEQCTFDQLEQETRPDRLFSQVLGSRQQAP